MGIKRLLMPAAWTLVVAHVLLQAALVLRLVLGHGFEFDTAPAWLSALLALTVGLAVCWADVGRRARPVVVAALVVTLTGSVVLVGLGAVSLVPVLSVATGPVDVVGQLLLVASALLVSVLAILALVQLLPLSAAAPAGEPPALPAVPEPEPMQDRGPVWTPDRAAGAAWHTAGAAATGAAAADWGRPGERGGWTATGQPQGTGPSGPDFAGSRPPQPMEGTQPRPPVDFGPRAQHSAGQEPAEDPDTAQVAPDSHGAGNAAAATGSPNELGPRALGRRYTDTEEDLTRAVPPGVRRQPPRWTPLEDSTQPPPQT